MKLKKIMDSIAFRISISIALVVAATTIAVGWLILTEEKRTLEFELQSKGRYLAELMSRHVVEPLLYEERYAIFSLLEASIEGNESLIVYGEVYDKHGEVLVTVYKDKKYQRMMPSPVGQDSMEIKEDKDSFIYHISLPIHVEALGTIGFLRLGITKEFLYITLKGVRQKLYLLAAAIIFIGIMLGLWMARKILRPILILHKGVRSVAEGDLGVEVPIVGEGEIKELALSFNRMSVKLKKLVDDIKTATQHFARTEKLYALGEFSAGVAHEIKNPFIMSHRGPLLESAFGDNMKARKSFAALSSTGYFLIFTPILLFGINVAPPADYNPAKHIQHIIYFEAGLLFLIGILHMGIMTIFSTKIKMK